MKDYSYQTLLDEYKAEEERKAKIDKMIAVLKNELILHYHDTNYRWGDTMNNCVVMDCY